MGIQWPNGPRFLGSTYGLAQSDVSKTGHITFWIGNRRPGLDSEYNSGYTQAMKTAISIPDDVFDAADEMARRLGMSRSQLYATAVREYLDAHREHGVTARLDRLYEHQDSSLELRVAEAQTASLDEEDW